eukprot:scaffold4085_cov113-Isochrysis_galbana.AAC.6
MASGREPPPGETRARRRARTCSEVQRRRGGWTFDPIVTCARMKGKHRQARIWVPGMQEGGATWWPQSPSQLFPPPTSVAVAAASPEQLGRSWARAARR